MTLIDRLPYLLQAEEEKAAIEAEELEEYEKMTKELETGYRIRKGMQRTVKKPELFEKYCDVVQHLPVKMKTQACKLSGSQVNLADENIETKA